MHACLYNLIAEDASARVALSGARKTYDAALRVAAVQDICQTHMPAWSHSSAKYVAQNMGNVAPTCMPLRELEPCIFIVDGIEALDARYQYMRQARATHETSCNSLKITRQERISVLDPLCGLWTGAGDAASAQQRPGGSGNHYKNHLAQMRKLSQCPTPQYSTSAFLKFFSWQHRTRASLEMLALCEEVRGSF